MNHLLLLLRQLSLLLLIGVVSTRNVYEEEIKQFLKENKLGEFLGLKGDLEYEVITPIKRNHLGNKLTRNVKEDFPEEQFYTIEGLGHKFELHLKKNVHAVDDYLQLTTRNEDGTVSNQRIKGSSGGLYHGTATSHLGSRVALSTYGGLTGLIRTQNGDFIIEKLPHHLRKRDANSEDEQEHIIYKKTSTGKRCETYKRDDDSDWEYDDDDEQPPKNKYFVETAVFADKQLYEQFKKRYGEGSAKTELLNYIKASMNAIQLMYNDPSLLQVPIQFILMRVDIFMTDEPGFHVSDDAEKLLDNFCKWQGQMNNPDDKNLEHWDHAFMFTGRDITGGIIGIAPLGGMCYRDHSCTLTEMKTFVGVYTAAHEAGHNFGMEHDGDDNDCDKHKYLMAPMDESGQITWSTCSKSYIQKYISKSRASCLSDSRPDSIIFEGQFPGQKYNIEQQCQFLVGSESATHYSKQSLSDICYAIKCIDKEHSIYTRHPALEGTDCGADNWCRSGKCVPRNGDTGSKGSDENPGDSQQEDESSKPIDGGWSEWSSYSPCKDSCIKTAIAVQISTRQCNNPSPENGGKKCDGLNQRVKQCEYNKACKRRTHVNSYATKVCQKYKWNRGIQHQKDETGACWIFCEKRRNTYYNIFEEGLPNGVVCLANGDTYCINGKCTPLS